MAALVGDRAAALITPKMRLGLGSGRMARAFVEALRPRVAEGMPLFGFCTSKDTERLAHEVGIAILRHSGKGLDLDVDGADEFDDALNLLKGGGGALLREKMVAQRSRRFLVLADASKHVERLGARHPLPVEVLRYDWEGTAHRLELRLGGRARLREKAGRPFLTDNGNYVVDLELAQGLDAPETAARELEQMAGVLGHGLFLGLAQAGLVFARGEVQQLGDLRLSS
ncbi:MAG: ribose-5-phosphate isomerase RpiA [Candidatus Dormibacteria bacterium]